MKLTALGLSRFRGGKSTRMARSYFGTDGIRGEANVHPMTAEVALRVGLAAGKVVFTSASDRRHLVVIGKDTRLSGYMLEPALVAGFTSVGMDVQHLRPAADAGGGDDDPLDARRPRGDDLGLAQPFEDNASSCSAPTATSSPTSSSRDRGLDGRGRAPMLARSRASAARAHRRGPGPIRRIAKGTLPKNSRSRASGW